MFNPIGSVHGGIAATILDSCMGCAVHTTLPSGTGYTTGDLHIRYLRAMTMQTGRVLAEGTVVHAGRRQATAESRLTAQDSGKLIATGTAACVVLAASARRPRTPPAHAARTAPRPVPERTRPTRA